MNLKKEDFIKLEKAISLLEDISKDIERTNEIDVIIANATDVILSLPKRTKAFVVEKKYVDYLDSIRAELMGAEKIIDDIKDSAEWKKAINYFNTYHTRGKLESRPTKKNGYTYKINDKYYNHNKPLSKEYVDYLEKARVEIIKAEEVINKIKSSNQWKRCQSYFITCEHRNLLEYKPSKKNGYTFKEKEF